MTALWLLLKPHALLIGSGLAIFLGGFALGYNVGRPKSPVTVSMAHAQTDTVRQLVKQTDTLVRVKTHLLAHTDTTFQHLRDTVLREIHDTVIVKRFIQACDSLKGACDAYRDAAQAKFHADSLLFAAQSQEISAWKANQPSRFGLTIDGGYNITTKHPLARGEVSYALSRSLKAVGVASFSDSSGTMRARQLLLLRYTIH